MERIIIKGLIREERGKKVKRLRRGGYLPAVIYDKQTNQSIKLSSESVKALKSIRFSESVIIDVEMERESSVPNSSVLIKEVQFHPLTEEVTHVDFVKVSMTEKVRVNVPLMLKGDPAGGKDGGVLEQVLWEVEIEGFPLAIPPHIDVDITDLKIGHSIHVKDLDVSEDYDILSGGEETIVTIIAQVEETEEAAEELLEDVPAGPQVLKEKPKDGQEEKKEG